MATSTVPDHYLVLAGPRAGQEQPAFAMRAVRRASRRARLIVASCTERTRGREWLVYRPGVRRLLLLLAAMAIIAGCSTTIQGEASPVGAGSGEAVIDLPPRPRELSLKGVLPCSLLTTEQQISLGLDDLNPTPGASRVEIFTGPECTYLGNEPRDVTMGFTLVTSNGIEALTRPGAVRAEIIPTTVSEFPAVILHLPSLGASCSLNIDVAEGEFLNLVFLDDELPPAPFEQICEYAKNAAAQALVTLEANS